jgi:hypothetical protein
MVQDIHESGVSKRKVAIKLMQVEKIVASRVSVNQVINEINSHWDLSLCEAMV